MRQDWSAEEGGGGAGNGAADWQHNSQRNQNPGVVGGMGRLFKELVVGGVVGECSNIAEQQQQGAAGGGVGGSFPQPPPVQLHGGNRRSRSITPHGGGGTGGDVVSRSNPNGGGNGNGNGSNPLSQSSPSPVGGGKAYVAYAPQAPFQLTKGRLFMLALMLLAVCIAFSSIITVVLVSRVQRTLFDVIDDAGLFPPPSSEGGDAVVVAPLQRLSVTVNALQMQQVELAAQIDHMGNILGFVNPHHNNNHHLPGGDSNPQGRLGKGVLERQASIQAKSNAKKKVSGSIPISGGDTNHHMTFQEIVSFVSDQKQRLANAPPSTPSPTKDVASSGADKKVVDGLKAQVEGMHTSVDAIRGAVNQLRAAMGLPALGESAEERDRRVQQELQRRAEIDRKNAGGGQRGFQFEDHDDGGRGGNPVPNDRQDGIVGVQPVPPEHRPDNYNPYAVHYQKPREVADPAAGVNDPDARCAKQRDVIRNDFKDAWGAYKKYAWGKDELKPVSKKWNNWGGKGNKKGMALTAVDALSTLYIMGFKSEFDEAVEYITNSVDFFQNAKVSVFEFVIRITGGLVSAYELSGERNPKLIETAQRVTDTLLWAYNTTTGLPHQTVNMKNKRHWSSDWAQGGSFLSEMGTVQMEFRTLSFHTRNPIYDMRGSHVTDILYARCESNGFLCPTTFNTHTAQALDDHITIGSLSDSYYEYLVKQYVLTGETEPRYKKMATDMLDAVIGRLLRYSNPGRQAFISELVDGDVDQRMDHLGCFVGGLFALGADTFPDHNQVKTYRRVAADITETCYNMYAYQLSGLPPESVNFPSGGDFQNAEPRYLLRPEVLESIFYQWRATKDPKYRVWAWNIYKHIRAYCRVPETGGFTSVDQITIIPPIFTDSMESFFLAETLKYLYLIFADDDVLDLKKWVLNTEAHPLRIRRRDPLDVWREWERSHPGEPPLFLPPTIDGINKHTETDAMSAVRRRSQPIFAKVDFKGSDTVPADEIDYNEMGEPQY